MGEKKDYLRKEQFRRYQAKPFRNPYFQAPRGDRRPWKRYGLIAGATALAVGVIYLFGFAPFWNIKNVRVQGLQFMAGDEIVAAANKELDGHRYLLFPERNRLFFNAGHLTAVLDQQFSFESLAVSVKGDTVMIAVKERVSQVLWMTGDQAFFVDVAGTVIRALPADDAALLVWHGSTQPSLNSQPVEGPYPRIAYLSSLPLIVNKDEKIVTAGEKVLTDKGIAGMIAMNSQLADHGLPATTFGVEHADSVWADTKLLTGFDVLFDTTQDAATQVGYLMTVLEKEADRSSIDYIDVRFGDHVYIKRK